MTVNGANVTTAQSRGAASLGVAGYVPVPGSEAESTWDDTGIDLWVLQQQPVSGDLCRAKAVDACPKIEAELPVSELTPASNHFLSRRLQVFCPALGRKHVAVAVVSDKGEVEGSSGDGIEVSH